MNIRRQASNVKRHLGGAVGLVVGLSLVVVGFVTIVLAVEAACVMVTVGLLKLLALLVMGM